eukprot:scaffold20079_cov88-Phaeocystis_antarctica.AAC.1
MQMNRHSPFRLFRSSLFETKGRTRKRGTVQLARARDPPRANVRIFRPMPWYMTVYATNRYSGA